MQRIRIVDEKKREELRWEMLKRKVHRQGAVKETFGLDIVELSIILRFQWYFERNIMSIRCVLSRAAKGVRVRRPATTRGTRKPRTNRGLGKQRFFRFRTIAIYFSPFCIKNARSSYPRKIYTRIKLHATSCDTQRRLFLGGAPRRGVFRVREPRLVVRA